MQEHEVAEPKNAAVTILDPQRTAFFDEVVGHLRSLARRAQLQHALEVGDYLIETFYGGDVHAYYAPDAAGHASFAALCRERADELEEIGHPRDRLRLYIRCWDAWRQLPPLVHEQIGLSKLVRLLSIHDPATRNDVAVAAVQNGWTVKQLEAAVAAEVADERPRRSPPRATVDRARRAVRELGVTTRKLEKWHEVLATQTPRQRAAAREEAVAAVARLQALIAAIEAVDLEGGVPA